VTISTGTRCADTIADTKRAIGRGRYCRRRGRTVDARSREFGRGLFRPFFTFHSYIYGGDSDFYSLTRSYS